MRAERWLANERDLIERAAETGERWLTPAERAAKAAVVAEPLSEFGSAMDRPAGLETAYRDKLSEVDPQAAS